MSEINKYILNSTEGDLNESLRDIFVELKLEVISSVDDSESAEIIFEFINSAEKINNKYPQIFIGELDDRYGFLKSSGKSNFSEELAATDIGKLLIKRLLGDNSSLDFTVAFDGGLSSGQTLKVSDYFSSGYYSDILAKNAAAKEFDSIQVKNYFNFLCSYFSILSQSSLASLPVEVDYGSSEDFFVIQAYVGIEGIDIDSVLDSFQDVDNKKPFTSLLNLCSLNSNVLDCYILGKGERLVITGIWSKFDLKQQNVFVNNIDSFQLVNSKPEMLIEGSDLSNETINSIHGKSSSRENKSEDKDELNSKINHKRLAEFIMNARSGNEEHKGLSDIVEDDIDLYLESYPSEDLTSKLKSIDKKEIIDFLLNPELYDVVDNQVQEFYENKSSESVFDQISNQLEKLSIDDVEEILAIHNNDSIKVKGWLEKEDSHSVVKGGALVEDGTSLIKGTPEDLTEDVNLIKGSPEDLSEGVQIIKGTPEDLTEGKNIIKGSSDKLDDGEMIIKISTEDQWANKKQSILSEVMCLKNLVDDGKLKEDEIYERVKSLLTEKLDLGEDAGIELASGILENIAQEHLHNKRNESVSKSDFIKLRVSNEKMEADLDLVKDQARRMKRIIDGMKAQLVVTNEVASIAKQQVAEAVGTGQEAVVRKIMLELEDTKKKIQLNDKSVQMIREGHRVVIENKDDHIKDLENRLQESRAEESKGLSPDISKLLADNKDLENKASISEKRFEVVNEKLEEQIQTSNKKLSSLMAVMDTKLKVATEALAKFKNERKLLNDELIKLKGPAKVTDSNNQTNEEGEELSEDLLTERDGIIDELSDQLKENEDKLRESELNGKKLEQKLKFLSSKFVEARKVVAKSSGGGAGGRGDGDSAKTKQLEKRLEKLNQVNSSVNKDLSNKKLEYVNMKKENTVLQNKLDALERKLVKYEGKKVA